MVWKGKDEDIFSFNDEDEDDENFDLLEHFEQILSLDGKDDVIQVILQSSYCVRILYGGFAFSTVLS